MLPRLREGLLRASAVLRALFRDSALQRLSASALLRFRDSALPRFCASMLPRFRARGDDPLSVVLYG